MRVLKIEEFSKAIFLVLLGLGLVEMPRAREGESAALAMRIVGTCETTVGDATYLNRERRWNDGGFTEASAGSSGNSPEIEARTVASLPETPEMIASALGPYQILLEWTAVVTDLANRYELQRQAGDEWVPIAVANEALSGTNVVVSGLQPSTPYTFRIAAWSSTVRSEYGYASASTQGVNGEAPTLMVEPESGTTMWLRWADPSPRSEYRIDRKFVDGEWLEIGAVGGTEREFLDDDLLPTTLYLYRVRGGRGGGWVESNASGGTTFSGEGEVPAAARIDLVYARQSYVLIDWSYREGVVGYRLEARTGSGGDWVEVAHLSGWASEFTHEGVTPSTAYQYRLRGYNAAGYSPYTEIEVVTPPPRAERLDLGAKTLSYKEVELRWNDFATDIWSGYTVEIRDGTNWAHLTFEGPAETNFVAMGLTPATSYEFRIQAHNADGWSEWSYASATTLPLPEVPPLAPTLYADPASEMAVRVKWLAVERATGYELERKNLNGAWERIAVVALVTDYMDEGLQPSTLYAYRIRAGNEYGLSPYSNEAGAKTLAVPHPPEVPLLNGGAASQTQVQLFWEPVPGAQAYRLEKKNAAGGWDVIYETVAGPLRYHDEGLQSSTTYTYQLGALNGAGAWIYSAELVTKTYPRPLTEALVVSARAMSSSAIELSWAPMELAETYWVGKWVDGDWVFTVLGANATNYIETGLRAGTTYMFRVYGMNLVSSSPHVDMSVTTWGAMDGEIVIQSMQVEGGMSRMVLGGNTGQRFVVEGTSDFATWRDLTETLRLSDGMEVEVAVGSEAMIFYRTRRVD